MQESAKVVPAIVLDGVVISDPGVSNIPGVNIETAKGVVTLKYPDGSEVVKELPVKEVVVSKPMCNVGVSAKFTKNMGNYQSATVGVSLNVPAEYHEIGEVYDFAREWVDARMEATVTELSNGG